MADCTGFKEWRMRRIKMFKFENGQIVKDMITGFTGVVVARVNYMTGCN